MTDAIQSRPALLANFDERARELAAHGPSWLRDLRKHALTRFEELGFPTPALEPWRNTNVRSIAATAYSPAADGPDPDAGLLEATGPMRRIVLVNGRYSESLSTTAGVPGGVIAGSLARAIEERPTELEALLGRFSLDDHAFAALNTALFEDGALIAIPEGLRLDEPLAIVHLTSEDTQPLACFPRTVILAGPGSRGAVVEWFLPASSGRARYLNSAVTEIRVDENAALHHYRVQLEDSAASHVGLLHARQARDARFVSHNFDLGAALGRLDTTAVLEGQGAWCQLNGLYLTDRRQHIDNHSTLDHAVPHCESRELYKGILAGRSRAVFNGRIVVRPDAQKTDAKQSNPNLLLSPDALVHTRPQLEIYADDVRCTHGATIGRLDQDALFYLRSRGVGAIDARKMLIHAFAGEVLDRVEIAPLREWLDREIGERLERIEGR